MGRGSRQGNLLYGRLASKRQQPRQYKNKEGTLVFTSDIQALTVAFRPKQSSWFAELQARGDRFGFAIPDKWRTDAAQALEVLAQSAELLGNGSRKYEDLIENEMWQRGSGTNDETTCALLGRGGDALHMLIHCEGSSGLGYRLRLTARGKWEGGYTEPPELDPAQARELARVIRASLKS